MEKLDIQQITTKLKDAFLPYKCVVKTDDYENLVYLQIVDENENLIIKTPSVAINDIDESSLSTLIERTKETMESKGYPIY